MEKAMYQAYGFGYEEYSNKLSKLIEVEQKREKDYQKSLEIVEEVDRNFHP
ncbi:hypothetical protein [Sutcliffiella horikoshii]|uniref:hypothetical protein n=1 Tax=Sutcliffiella horikoshii TaxID=79883 RepID=UPI001CFCD228|nr:hypothetical protein [Sutcliffiella horikoshii]